MSLAEDRRSEFALSARGLGKRYRRGALAQQHNSVRDLIRSNIEHLVRRENRPAPSYFWALKDVSFDIARGENVGIIGLNGAGKSTLLKVLSQITTPTEGRARVVGRLGALLEVGTGFHRELTGRENVYLYGSILGMGRAEVARKFDTIIEFSEIGDFIDTPVKHYSSGMYVRLAFSVAAHLDPDILLLDEVLAVGDFAFQRKCMDFARGLEQKGATILFVSHNMFSIKTMCQRVIYLKGGQVAYDGPTDEGLKRYEADSKLAIAPWFHEDPNGPAVSIIDVSLCGEDGEERTVFDYGERVLVRLKYKAHRRIEKPDVRIGFNRDDDVHCCSYSTIDDKIDIAALDGEGEIELRTPPLNLVSAMYTATIAVRERGHGRMLSAHLGAHFHIRHDLLAPHAFGVFHQSAEWKV